MAAGYLKQFSGGAIDVRSAGSEPADKINPVAVQAMAEEGIDIAAEQPTILTTDAVQASDVVITMGCGDSCPYYRGKRYEDWTLDDPAGQGIDVVRAIRNQIRQRVGQLVQELLGSIAMSNGSQPDFLEPPVRADGPIRLVDPDPVWAAQYAGEEERIRAALGARAVQVEHVGSTSVPGLAAKPVIDIVLTVIDSANEAGYLPDLEAAGYVLQFREPDWYEHRFLRDHNPDVQVHVFTARSPEVERMLLFRDRLRARPEERELYERTKRELAARRWNYIQDYADAKSSVVEEIISRGRSDQKRER